VIFEDTLIPAANEAGPGAVNVPSPFPRNTKISPLVESATAISMIDDPVRNEFVVIDTRLDPPGRRIGDPAVNVPSPFPIRMPIVAFAGSINAASAYPSPLKSPVAIPLGAENPTGDVKQARHF
jgi:hypothetical protein